MKKSMKHIVRFAMLLGMLSACGATPDQGADAPKLSVTDPIVRPLGPDTDRVELSLDPGAPSSEHEAPYCTGAGSCLPSGHTCCTGAIQTTHTTCSIGKCCRVRGSACATDTNVCCYPNQCLLFLNGFKCEKQK
jgi:hypothetical protein